MFKLSFTLPFHFSGLYMYLSPVYFSFVYWHVSFRCCSGATCNRRRYSSFHDGRWRHRVCRCDMTKQTGVSLREPDFCLASVSVVWVSLTSFGWLVLCFYFPLFCSTLIYVLFGNSTATCFVKLLILCFYLCDANSVLYILSFKFIHFLQTKRLSIRVTMMRTRVVSFNGIRAVRFRSDCELGSYWLSRVRSTSDANQV